MCQGCWGRGGWADARFDVGAAHAPPPARLEARPFSTLDRGCGARTENGSEVGSQFWSADGDTPSTLRVSSLEQKERKERRKEGRKTPEGFKSSREREE